MRPRYAPLTLVALAFAVRLGLADVDLVTLPSREGTQLTIYNSEDITMVREHRLLTVKPGVNRIQFTWANTLIDPTSIDFRILDHHGQVDLIDTTFPAGRNDALQWNIQSRMAGKVSVEIRYFTSGIMWSASYVGIANQDEDRLRLTGYVRVENNSGELYDNAETRLVVGAINLVEKIADLAQQPAPTVRFADRPVEERQKMRLEYENALGRAGGFGGGMFAPATKPEAPKEIIKQGLSEYFLFAIEGHEDIKDQEPIRLVCLQAAEIPLECLYRATDRDGGTQLTKYYRFKNDKLTDEEGQEKQLPSMENLGTSPLPNGSVRLFSEYANKDLAYVGGAEVKYVPIGDRVEVNVGVDRDVTIARRLKDQRVDHVVARQYERRLDDQFIQHYDLVDYDETFVYEEEIISGKSAQIKVEVERHFDANVIIWSEADPPADWGSNEPGAYVDLHQVPGRVERIDQNHVKYFLDLSPGEKKSVTYEVTYKRRKIGPELNVEKIRRPL